MSGARGGVQGEIARSSMRGDVVVSETRYRADTLLREHVHENAYVSVLIAGTYTEVLARETRLCRPTTAIFHPAGESHADHFAEAGSCINVELRPYAVRRLAELGFCVEGRAVLDPAAGRAAIEFLGWDESRTHDGAHADDLLVEIAAASDGGCDAKAPRWFPAAIEVMSADLAEPLAVLDVAQRTGVHPTHLARAFRRLLQCSPTEFRRRRRFESAARSLRETRLSVAEIAHATGFADESHLVRTFKSWSGMTPGWYRRRFAQPYPARML